MKINLLTPRRPYHGLPFTARERSHAKAARANLLVVWHISDGCRVHADILAVPTATNEAVLIISLRVNPILFLRFEFIIAARFSLLFPFEFPRDLISCIAKSSQFYGNCHSRSIPCSSESNYADICVAGKDFAIVDQLSNPLRARTQSKRCQYLDSASGPGRGCKDFIQALLGTGQSSRHVASLLRSSAC